MANRKSRLIDWETLLAGISRRKGPVEYSAKGGLIVQSGLLSVVLHD